MSVRKNLFMHIATFGVILPVFIEINVAGAQVDASLGDVVLLSI